MRPVVSLEKASRSLRLSVSFSPRIQSNFSRRYLSQNTNGRIAQLLEWKPESGAQNVVVNGYVRSSQKSKEFRFVSIGDGSSLKFLQAVVPRDLVQLQGYEHHKFSNNGVLSPILLILFLQSVCWVCCLPDRFMGALPR